MRPSTTNRLLAATALSLLAALPAMGQLVLPPTAQATHFKDPSILKPPTGAKIAIIEFEDLECPACAQAAQIVRSAVEKYQIAYVHRDFPLGGAHIWSLDAAITARYLQDKAAPKTAEQYRLDVFAAQNGINSREDLDHYTSKWFSQHNLQRPFVIDPSGLFKQEVMSDRSLGDRLGVDHTPTIVVVSEKHWIEVANISQLFAAIEKTKADVASEPAAPAKPATAAHNNVRKSTVPAK